MPPLRKSCSDARLSRSGASIRFAGERARHLPPRLTSRRTIIAGFAGASLAGAFYAAALAPRLLQTVRLRVGFSDLPEPLHGLRIAHLSDFHAGGPGVSARLLARARRVALNFRPEIVALTGDYMDGPVSAALFDMLTAWPDWTQVVAVLGNHDYERPETLRELAERFKRNGVHLLNNEARELCVRGEAAWIVGVEDPFSLRDNPISAFAGLPPCKQALLYLAHSPSGLARLPADRFRLMLSGHTHGGQIRILPSGRVPFVPLLRWLTSEHEPYAAPDHYRGVHRLGTAALVISEGLGTSQIPIRVRSRPQVILIELVKSTGRTMSLPVERQG